MIKKVYILTLLMTGLLCGQSIAQGAQATMRVSVRVVSGSSVEMNQPNSVTFENNKASSLGMLTLRGFDNGNILISNTQKVKLTDGSGNELLLNIRSRQHITDKDQEQISYEGTSAQEKMVSSVYKGQLTTTVEYF